MYGGSRTLSTVLARIDFWRFSNLCVLCALSGAVAGVRTLTHSTIMPLPPHCLALASLPQSLDDYLDDAANTYKTFDVPEDASE